MAAAFEIEFPDFSDFTFALSQTIPVAHGGLQLGLSYIDFRQIFAHAQKGLLVLVFSKAPTKKEPVS